MTNQARSIWSKTVEMEARLPLAGDIQTEVAIIGAGLCGVLCGRFLAEAGKKVVLLEAERIANGQTKHTTAKITSQHHLIYDKLLQSLGKEKAAQYAAANQAAIGQYRRLAGQWGIDCDLVDVPAYLYSEHESEPLERELAAALALGIPADMPRETSLPFAVRAALRFRHQAMFHPLKFLAAAAQGLTIYEQTRALHVEDEEIETPRGTVRAEQIIFACHYPFVNMPGYYFLRMHQERSYVLALENAGQLDGAYLGIDADGLSFRNWGKLLLLGGGNHRTGENSAGGQYKHLRTAAQRFWPQSREVAHWSAQDCMTLDGVPYIGVFSNATPNWYVATGFQKWGMSSSMVAASILCDLILGQQNDHAEVFSPQRFHAGASAKNLLEAGRQALKGLGREFLTLPMESVAELPPGHGGVVEHQGVKVGVYKEENGTVHAVSTRCPHLGCQVEWNPDEKTWDCPCHGSRYDFAGRLIDNPAQEGLEVYHLEEKKR